MAAPIEVREVKVAELRRGLSVLMREQTPIIVRRNSVPRAVVLHLKRERYLRNESTRAERRRLRAELEAVLRVLRR